MSLPLRPRACPLCGSGDDSVVVAEADIDVERLDQFAFASRKVPELMHHRLVACPTCDLVYASPAPTPESLEAAYGEAGFDSSEEARCASATYADLVKDLLPTLPPAGGVLDIGTGEGSFLTELLALGFDDVAGSEPSLAPIGAAPAEVADRIRPGVFRADDFEAGRFRLVTIFQTLEHLDDPLTVCRDARRLLCDGGVLLVVAHDRRALVNRLLGRRSPIYDVEHLQLFSPPSLRGLLERAGFDDVATQPIVNRYPLRYWARLLPLPRAAKDAGVGVLERVGVAGALVGLRVGNRAAVGYRR
ncbi:MAG: class I SAM-dependent methyltransferase [Actinomycetota bacterium]|nr:class I SAM-dependent methyltransferase [Actinomycetota bacterium]